MKKFLLAALAIFGLAAPIGATLPQSGHAYKIKHQASNLWLNTEIDGRGDATGRHCASLETEENASILFFIQNPENEAQWEIRTAFSEGPILASSTGWVSIIDNAKPFYWGLTEQADGSFVITRNAEADSSKNVFAPDNNTATSPLWTDKWKSDKSNWIIGEEVPTVEVTYKYPAYKTHPQIIKNVIAGVGANTTNFLPVRPDFFTTSGVSEENKIISETNKEFNVAGTWSYPIEANHVYRMKLKPSETASKFMHFDGNEANLTYTDIEQDAFSTDFFWYFTAGTMTENGQIPVTLHGMSMTANQGLEFGTGDESNGHQSTTPTVWYIRPTTLAAEGYRDFMLQHTEKNAENGMDVFINYRGGKVSTWSTITSRVALKMTQVACSAPTTCSNPTGTKWQPAMQPHKKSPMPKPTRQLLTFRPSSTKCPFRPQT